SEFSSTRISLPGLEQVENGRESRAGLPDATVRPPSPFRECQNGTLLRFVALPCWHTERAPDKLRPLPANFSASGTSTTCKRGKKYLSNPLLYKSEPPGVSGG